MRLICRLSLSLVLLAPLSSLTLAALPSAPLGLRADDDELFERLLKQFEKRAASGTLEERSTALEALVAAEHEGVLPALSKALGSLSTRVRKLENKLEHLQLDLQNKQRLIADLDRRVERDPGLKAPLGKQRLDLQQLQGSYARRRSSLAGELPWQTELRRVTSERAARTASAVRKKLEKALWQSLDGDASLDRQFGAISVLGVLGGDGTATRLQKSLAGLVKQRALLQRKLPKQMGEVRELEARIQEEAKRTGGRSSYGQQYERLIAEAKQTQEDIGAIGRLCETLLQAGGSCLAREDESRRAKSVVALLRAQKKGKNGVRRYTLRMLGSSGLAEVRAALLEMLENEPDPLVRATLIDALALGARGQDFEALEAYLIEQGLEDESWLVKGRAARSLASLRSKRAIPPLIERLGLEKGRILDELDGALQSLSGLDYHGNATLWQRWWKDEGEAFVVPSVELVSEKVAQREKDERAGTGFFGITSASEHVLFVVDLSGSMVFAMIPRDNPEDDISGGRRPDMPREGERSRLDEAKLALVSAIGSMGREGTFNLIFYAADVWSWKAAPKPMSDKNVAEALETVSELEAVGGTNIYGALRAALDMAGAETTDSWQEPQIDTIFFLSDGRASFGITTDPDEILAFVRERNSSAGITIHTIGLSGAQDAYLLGRLAEENGGRYVAR